MPSELDHKHLQARELRHIHLSNNASYSVNNWKELRRQKPKGCVNAGKSICRELVEGDFEAAIKSLVPSRELFDLASAIFRDLWDQRVESSGTQKKHMAAEISQFDRKVEQLVERLLSAESETVIRVYESQI
jgi:site-specific DNA recombinase